jgi:hypothetical protein
MKALGASMYLLTVAVGTYLASALNIIVAKIFAKDPWVAGARARARAAASDGARLSGGTRAWGGGCRAGMGLGGAAGAAARNDCRVP